MAALISISFPQPDTRLHCDMMHYTVCLFTPQLLLLFIAIHYREMARLH